MANELWIVPFLGQGHISPLMELCKQLASRNFKSVLVISSNVSSSVPSSLRQYPLVEIAEVAETTPSEQPPPPQQQGSHPPPHGQMAVGLESLLLTRNGNRPVCQKFEIPAVGFFTSGACSTAMEYVLWKAHQLDIKPEEICLLPGLPEEMAVTSFDIKRHSPRPPFPLSGGDPLVGGGGGLGRCRMGSPGPGEKPNWLEEIEQSIGVMINTCDGFSIHGNDVKIYKRVKHASNINNKISYK